MGTSRGPIREAIRILTGTGLVTPVVNRGVFVRKVSIQECWRSPTLARAGVRIRGR